MKKIFLFVVMAICANSVMAQKNLDSLNNHKSHGRKGIELTKQSSAQDRAVEYSNFLKSKLNLSDSQYQQIWAVNTACIQKKDSLRMSNNGGNGKMDKSAIKEFRNSQFSKILSSDQMNQLKSLQENENHKQPALDNHN